MAELYTLADTYFFESPMQYRLDATDFLPLLSRELPNTWAITRRRLWYDCCPRSCDMPDQGWKIHISATMRTCRDTLQRALSVISRLDIPFKVVADCTITGLINSKAFDRGSSGKFITIYPSNDIDCGTALEQLSIALKGCVGPYILSDRRYGDSGVVFYRYGGFLRRDRISLQGVQEPLVLDATGEYVKDQRKAHFTLPRGVEDPFAVVDKASRSSVKPMIGGRFSISRPLKFSNTGGVYIAEDSRTGESVVVKEARPFTQSTPDGQDAVSLLRKEWSILTELRDTSIGPAPYDYLTEWEHAFLVEERIAGDTLAAWVASNGIVTRLHPSRSELKRQIDSIASIGAQLAQTLEKLHSHQVVFADLSPGNIIVGRDMQTLRLVDFEAAVRHNHDANSNLLTPGFREKRSIHEMPDFDDDYFGLGAVLMSMILPITPLLGLDKKACIAVFRDAAAECRLPTALSDLIIDLVMQPRGMKPCASTVQQCVATLRRADDTSYLRNPTAYEPDLANALQGIWTSFPALATTSRSDRLFPCDALVFDTNPASLAYGASGVVLSLLGSNQAKCGAYLDWLCRCDEKQLPPGLFMGRAGVALVLARAGRLDEATSLLPRSALWDCEDECGLGYGYAGVGMICLLLAHLADASCYLEWACEIAARMERLSRCSAQGRHWLSHDKTPIGLGHGASGIAIYFLYLAQVTGDNHWLTVGQEALAYDLEYAVETHGGGMMWPRSGERRDTLYPYWEFGTAGIAAAVSRYFYVTEDSDYRALLNRMVIELGRPDVLMPNLFRGAAGMAYALLDCHHFAKLGFCRDSAALCLRRAMLYGTWTHDYLLIPGRQLERFSCDLATGSAGVALALDRFHHPEPRHGLLPDDLLDSSFQLEQATMREARTMLCSNCV